MKTSKNTNIRPEKQQEDLFEWGTCWSWCTQYNVTDLQKETDFYLNTLGFKMFTYDETFAMFTNKPNDMFISVKSSEKEKAAIPGSMNLQFMIKDIVRIANELEEKGVDFTEGVGPYKGYENLYKGSFKTPNGITIELWGMKEEHKEQLQ